MIRDTITSLREETPTYEPSDYKQAGNVHESPYPTKKPETLDELRKIDKIMIAALTPEPTENERLEAARKVGIKPNGATSDQINLTLLTKSLENREGVSGPNMNIMYKIHDIANRLAAKRQMAALKTITDPGPYPDYIPSSEVISAARRLVSDPDAPITNELINPQQLEQDIDMLEPSLNEGRNQLEEELLKSQQPLN